MFKKYIGGAGGIGLVYVGSQIISDKSTLMNSFQLSVTPASHIP